jgi:hypothetical protein
MYVGKTLFAQVMDFLPWSSFHRIVERYRGDYRVRTMTCAEHFRALAFAQLTYRESLRDIEACLSAHASKLYHLGFREPVKRSTLADANEARDWRIYADFAQLLIRQARRLYADEPLGVALSSTAYAMDSTTITLCLALFPWATLSRFRAGVKMHTLLDLRGAIPSFIHISQANCNDMKALDLLVAEAGAFYVLDRGYLDWARLHALHRSGSFFITRAKSCLHARRLSSSASDRSCGVLCDQTIALQGFYTRQRYPDRLRRIRFYDRQTDRHLVFLTNHGSLPALTICQLYKQRWQIELFFKWIKQHLRIQRFYGNSENAVKTQIWIAISVYVLIAIIKKRLQIEASLHTLLQILSVTLFEKMPIQQAFSRLNDKSENPLYANQLNLFGF